MAPDFLPSNLTDDVGQSPVLLGAKTPPVGKTPVRPNLRPKTNGVAARKRGGVAIDAGVAVVGNLRGINGHLRHTSIRAGVGGVGNRRPVPGGRVNLVQSPLEGGVVTAAPAGFGIDHLGTCSLPEIIDVAALVINLPFVVVGIADAVEKIGVHLGIKFTGGSRWQQFELLAKQIKDETLGIVVAVRGGGWVAGRVLDWKTVFGISLNVAYIQLPTHPTPAVVTAGRINQGQIRLRTVPGRRALDGNRITKASGE